MRPPNAPLSLSTPLLIGPLLIGPLLIVLAGAVMILPDMALAQPLGPTPGGAILGGPNSGLYSSPETASLCQAPGSGSTGSLLDGSIIAMKDRLDTLGAGMAARAQSLMMGLLVVDFVLRGGRWAIRNDPMDVMMLEWSWSLGFVIVAWGMAEVIPEVVSWLAGLALDFSSAAGAVDVSPSGLVTGGIRQAICWLDLIVFTSPGTWFYIFASAISLVALAMMVAMLIITYAQLYLVGLAGIITLGFAGLAQTRSIATGFFMTLIGLAMKLFGIMVIVAATGEISTAIAQYGGTGFVAGFEAAMTIIMLQIITGMLILTLPSTLERLVVGAKSSGGGAEAAGKAIGSVGIGAAKAAGGATLGKGAGLAKIGARTGASALRGRIGR